MLLFVTIILKCKIIAQSLITEPLLLSFTLFILMLTVSEELAERRVVPIIMFAFQTIREEGGETLLASNLI